MVISNVLLLERVVSLQLLVLVCTVLVCTEDPLNLQRACWGSVCTLYAVRASLLSGLMVMLHTVEVTRFMSSEVNFFCPISSGKFKCFEVRNREVEIFSWSVFSTLFSPLFTFCFIIVLLVLLLVSFPDMGIYEIIHVNYHTHQFQRSPPKKSSS